MKENKKIKNLLSGGNTRGATQRFTGFIGHIRSKYIVQRIFSYMREDLRLKIAQYNKSIQERLDLDEKTGRCIDAYIEHTPIVFELGANEVGDFINIPDKDKEYYHIYLGGSEIKRADIKKGEVNKKIRVTIGYQVTSLEALFRKTKVSWIKCVRCDRLNVASTRNMFCEYEKN